MSMTSPPSIKTNESERPQDDDSMNIEAQMASPSGSGIFQLPEETIKALEEAKAKEVKSHRASNDGRELLKQPFDSWR